MQTPVKTPTRTPTRTSPETTPAPERFYQPERLCPTQRDDGVRWSAP